MRFKVVLLLAGLLTSWPGWTQPEAAASAPVLKAGDRWQYQILDGFTGIQTSVVDVFVVEVKTDGYRLETSTSGAVRQSDVTLGLNERQLIDGVARDTGELDFPLTVGKKWRSLSLQENTSNGTISLLDMEREVVAFEKLRVPAGEFDTYKVVATGQWILKSDPLKVAVSDFRGRYVLTAWYAPAVKRYVAVQAESYAKGHTGRRFKQYLTKFEIN